MLNASKLLPIHERIIVLDKVSQKLCNSGYSLPEIRRSMVGALTGYERRLAASMKDVEEKGYRPLHESSANSLSDRLKKKLTGKSTWFKGKSKVDTEQEEGTVGGQAKNMGTQGNKSYKGVKTKVKKLDGSQMETTNVMFVDNTPHGELCRRLQTCENRSATVTNRRVKMVEMGGSKLGQLLSNTNPWAGAGCDREDCHTCNQGGSEKKEDCFRRNVLYESRCVECQEKEELEKEKAGGEGRKRKGGENFDEKCIYVGGPCTRGLRKGAHGWCQEEGPRQPYGEALG